MTKDDGPFELSMTTLITHGCDQDDMHEDVGGDDYVDSNALMMINMRVIKMIITVKYFDDYHDK